MEKRQFIIHSIQTVRAKLRKDDDKVSLLVKLCINKYFNLYRTTYTIIKDKEATWKELLVCGTNLSIIYEYTDDYETQRNLTELIIACWGRAFMICPIRKRHLISYTLYNFIKKNYIEYPWPGSNNYNKSTCIGELVHDYYCQNITSVSFNEANYRKHFGLINSIILRAYLSEHILKFCVIDNNGSKCFDLEKIKKTVEGYQKEPILNNKETKEVSIQIFKNFFESITDEELSFIDITDDQVSDGLYEFDSETNKVHYIDFYQLGADEMERVIYHDNYEDSNKWDYQEDDSSYGRYAGSYAQDEMGYSDDDIDTIFDGDPSAYWNID